MGSVPPLLSLLLIAISGWVHRVGGELTAQEDRFAAEQVQAPEAVLGLGDQCQPGGPLDPESPGR